MSKFSIGTGKKFNKASDIEPLLSGLTDGVEQVDLGGNSYGVEASSALADRLANVKSLKVANLDDMFTGRLREEIPQSLDVLLEALLQCPSLHTLNLNDNAFGIATVEPLEKFLSKHTPLEHLYMSNNGLGPEAGSRLGKALEKLAHAKRKSGSKSALQTVVCGRNRLENGSMAAWAKLIEAHGTIKELQLYQNGIRQEGIVHIMRHGLIHAPHLRKLDLQDNTFTLSGSEALADILPHWPSIEEIIIDDCLLSSAGVSALAKALHETPTAEKLRVLRLQYNEIDEKALGLLFNAIKNRLTNLEHIGLNGNCFPSTHDHIVKMEELFGERGRGQLDDLDDMEELSDDEIDEEEEIVQDALEASVRDAEYAEEEPVTEVESGIADALADRLSKAVLTEPSE